MATAHPGDRIPSNSLWPVGTGLVVTMVGFALAAGPVAIAAGGAVVATWYLLDGVGGFAVGQLFLSAFAPTATPVAIAISEIGLVVVLLAEATTLGSPSRVVISFGVAATLLGAITYAARNWTGSHALAAAALVATAVVAAYTIHRYELVTLSLLEGDAR